jgi:hypothetical protein
MGGRKISIVFALLALLSLTGTECYFVVRSGGSDSSDTQQDDQDNGGLVVVVREGRLVDAPVEGVGYHSASLAGVTGPGGEFQYLDGERVAFSIGDIALGNPVTGKALVTPLDMVPEGTLDSPAVINIARLLLSLDARPGDDRITIPVPVRIAAVRTDAGAGPAIRFLDFSDDTRFANSAAQLVATLTANYPFTAVLVDVATARAHLRDSLAAAGVTDRLGRVIPSWPPQ